MLDVSQPVKQGAAFRAFQFLILDMWHYTSLIHYISDLFSSTHYSCSQPLRTAITVFWTPQIKSKSTKIPTVFTMEVSFTPVYCDFLSPYISKVPFRARFFGVIWINISDSRMWRMVLQKTWVAQNVRRISRISQSRFFRLCAFRSLFFSREVVSRSLKAKNISKYRVWFFFVNDVWTS